LPELFAFSGAKRAVEKGGFGAADDGFQFAQVSAHGTRHGHAEPLPHVDFSGVSAVFTAPEDRTPEQAAAFAVREALASELAEADAVLIAAPMYNYTIASTLKAWLDQVIIKDRTFGATQSAKGTPTIVVASRGGSYAPGTPREGWEFVRNYLEKVLGELLGLDVEFIVPELTYASWTGHGAPDRAGRGFPQHCLRRRRREGQGARHPPRRVIGSRSSITLRVR
jgi:hypothetical protein